MQPSKTAPTTGGLLASIIGLGFGTKDRQLGEKGPDRQYDGDVEYVDFGEGQDKTRVYHNRMVYSNGSVEFWVPVLNDAGEPLRPLQLTTTSILPDEFKLASEQDLNNANGPLIEWSSENEIAVMTPPGVGSASPVQVGMRTGIRSEPETRSIVAYSPPEIAQEGGVFPDVALFRDFNITVVLKGQNFGFRDSHIDFVKIGGLRCRSVRQGADLSVLERFGTLDDVRAANISNLEGRYITCYGIEPIYEEEDADGNVTRIPVGNETEWPTEEVIVQVAGQKSFPSTEMDLQGVPTVNSLERASDAGSTIHDYEFDTSGFGQATVRGRGFGLDASDVIAVVFGPWRTTGIAPGEEADVVKHCVGPLMLN